MDSDPQQVLPLDPEVLRASTPAEMLAKLKAKVSTCGRCGLCSGRTQVVFGKGKTDRPDIAVVGEGPGANEDVHGEPFIGKAGQLLTKMLEAISYKREDVYIANVVMCRPPENRVPTKEEIRACKPYLYEQLRLVQPKTILALGITAAQCMFRSGKAMGEMRGFWGKWDDIPVRASYHPAYLLRPTGSARKADTWSDLKILAGKIATLSS